MRSIYLSFLFVLMGQFAFSQAQYQSLYSQYSDSIYVPKIDHANKLQNADTILDISIQAFDYYFHKKEYNRAMYMMQRGVMNSVYIQAPPITVAVVDSCLNLLRPLIDTNNVHFATLMEVEAFAYRIGRNMDPALELYNNIEAIYSSCNAPKILLYGIYQTMGSIYIERGKYVEGFKMYKIGLPYFKKEKDLDQLAFSYNEIANALQFTHQYELALELRIKSYDMTIITSPEFYNHAIFANNIADSYLQMKDYKKAIHWANYADSVMHHYGQTDELFYYYLTSLDIRYQVTLKLEKYDKCMEYAELIGENIVKYMGEESEFMTEYYLIKHNVFLGQNMFDSSFKYLQKTKEMNPDFPPLNSLYSEHYYFSGDYDSAIYYSKKSSLHYIADSNYQITENSVPNVSQFSKNTWTSLTGIVMESDLNTDLFRIAEYSRDAYKNSNSNSYIKQCIAYACLMDTLMAKSRDVALLGSDALQLAIDYHSLAAITLDANSIAYKNSNDIVYLNNCVNMMAQSASFSLNSQVAQMGGQSVLFDKEKAQQQIQLMLKIQQKENELLAAKEASNIILTTKISDDLLDMKLDAFELTAELQHIVALNSNHNSAMVIGADIGSIQSFLKEEEAIISYFVDDSSLYSLFVSKDAAIINSIPNDASLKSAIRNYYRGLKTNSSAFASNSRKMFDYLLGEYSDNLQNISNLTIIADGELSKIPFEALIYDNKNTFLIEKMAVNYSNSLYIWENNRKNHIAISTKDLSFVGFAPVFSEAPLALSESNPLIADAQLRGDFSDLRDGNKLKALPFSDVEVNSIEELFSKNGNSAKSYLYKDATEENIKTNIEPYNIVHIATHGYASKKEPELSGLFFNAPAKVDSLNITNDGFLYLGEIYNLKINADLVVLSACKSGSGKLEEGEGVIALPRAFVLNGVPNIISSLWKIHDKKTADFMVDFYKNVLKGNSYSKALQLTKINMIKNGELTMDWSGLVINGTGI